jgi:hypothetical protein
MTYRKVFPYVKTLFRLKRALERVDAGPNGKNTVYWTSLREVRTGDFSLKYLQD